MNSIWSKYEVELILNDYFRMLDMEIYGRSYKKSEFRKALRPALNNRSEGSIEFKHQNISAVLLKYKLPYIVGYKPRANYQALLEELVLEYLVKRKELYNLFSKFSDEGIITKPRNIEFSKLVVATPKNVFIKEQNPEYSVTLRNPDYLEIEQRNRNLGESGEELVLEYEKWRLINSGNEKLAEKVEWVSKEQGDGAGFDILSYNENGNDRYLEVKTTKLGELTPFYFTQNELRFSQKKSKEYYLYRVFKFNQSPNIFIKNGSFDAICKYEPTTFIGQLI